MRKNTVILVETSASSIFDWKVFAVCWWATIRRCVAAHFDRTTSPVSDCGQWWAGPNDQSRGEVCGGQSEDPSVQCIGYCRKGAGSKVWRLTILYQFVLSSFCKFVVATLQLQGEIHGPPSKCFESFQSRGRSDNLNLDELEDEGPEAPGHGTAFNLLDLSWQPQALFHLTGSFAGALDEDSDYVVCFPLDSTADWHMWVNKQIWIALILILWNVHSLTKPGACLNTCHCHSKRVQIFPVM